MNYENVLALAFEYKKSKLWKMMWEENLVALKLPDGTIAYLCVMGRMEDHIALGIYSGEDSLRWMRNVSHLDDYDDDFLAYHETMFSQECLQCSFENKDFMEPDQLERVQKYAKSHGIRFRGSHSYPQFLKYTKNHLPDFPDREEDFCRLAEGLEAALWLAGKLEKRSFRDELGLQIIDLDADNSGIDLPLLIKEKDGYRVERTPVPAAKEPSWPTPDADETITSPLKKKKKSGILECRLIQFPVPIDDADGGAPYFPFMLLSVKKKDGNILHLNVKECYEEHPEAFLEELSGAMLNERFFPSSIHVGDERTFCLLKDFVKKAGMNLRKVEQLPELWDAEASLIEEFVGDDEYDYFEDMFDTDDDLYNSDEDLYDPDEDPQEAYERELQEFHSYMERINEIPEQELRTMPQALKDRMNLLVLIAGDMMPKEFLEKWNRVKQPDTGGAEIVDIRSRTGKAGKKTGTEQNSETDHLKDTQDSQNRQHKHNTQETLYTLKVYPEGLGRTTYRVLSICGSDSLEQLCSEILASFHFTDEHMYEFCMDNRMYSTYSYQSHPEYPGQPSTSVRLNRLGLTERQKFLLHYDFGDDWKFIITVQKIEEVNGYHPAYTVKSKGSVEQYPDFW